jgi:adenine-specific DNA glycosylase
MYQFPLIEFHNLDAKTVFLQNQDFEYGSAEIKHILSHQHLFCHFVSLDYKPKSHRKKESVWVNRSEFFHYPVPRVIEKFVEDNLDRCFEI